MKKYKCVLFDLDGTLTDPFDGITKSVQTALLKYGIDEPDREKLRVFIGPPLRESFARYYGVPSEKIETVIADYREYFSKKGLFENEMYEGIDSFLCELSGTGVKILLATSKPEPYAKRICEHFGLSKYFFEMCGADFEGKCETKSQVVSRALSLCGEEKSDVIMVGDRMHDIIGAKENGIDSAGVLWGFGDREELERAGADIIFDSIADMRRAFFG